MTIQQAAFSRVKTEANVALSRARARQAQASAKVHIARVQRLMNKPQPRLAG